jgi:hypothetical protein
MTHQPVVVTWIDSCVDSDWSNTTDFTAATVQSVGWLLGQTDTLITIAQSLDGDGNSGERLTVPVVSVTDVTFLQ